jgi:molybdopterin molybdotransferase
MNMRTPLGQIDPHRCGCDSAPGALMPVDDALARGLARVRTVTQIEELALDRATGRVLAEPVRAACPLPPFDYAAMDGYALRLADLAGPGPWTLPVAARMRAGDAPCALPMGATCRILTGAALPDGAEAVVAQEDLARGDRTITLTHLPKPGEHIRRVGDDLPAGAEIVPVGRLIGAREAAAIAASGAGTVTVRARLRVAVLSTGSELVPPGLPLAPGQIWDANNALLAAALAHPWIERTDLGALPDEPDRLATALVDACARADLVISTGGVSVGDEDHMGRVFTQAGGTIHAMKIAMKPGKPLIIGQLGRALWLGLPGNPVAAFVTWTVIGARLAEAMAGIHPVAPRKTLARLAAPVRHKPGRCEYRPARILGYSAQGAPMVECLDAPDSHRVALLARAEGLALIPAEAEAMAAGDLIEFLPF